VIPSTVDRLRIFVSSTIKECAAERAAVREAIRSINHEPILFEDVGARPYPPRDVYKARLEISQIFVGVYRESYGWIAPDMEVSGLEDEFRLAQARGLDRLLYVYETPSGRDPKLQALIEEAKGAGITLAGYRDPEQLKNRVRDDFDRRHQQPICRTGGCIPRGANTRRSTRFARPEPSASAPSARSRAASAREIG
jgi:hypothetical protein